MRYSSINIVYILSLKGIMLMMLVLINFQQLSSKLKVILLVSTNSHVISTACYTLSENTDVYLLPVQWGVTDWNWNYNVRHYYFTIVRNVAPSIPDHLYT